MLSISKKQFEEICKKHNTLIILESDPAEALMFTYELLDAEIKALKEQEPYAVSMINRLEAVAYEIYDFCHAVEEQEFHPPMA